MRAATTGRAFAQAEPHYRAGFTAAHDERYAGRAFAAAASDLRTQHTSVGTGASRASLRQEVCAGGIAATDTPARGRRYASRDGHVRATLGVRRHATGPVTSFMGESNGPDWLPWRNATPGGEVVAHA